MSGEQGEKNDVVLGENCQDGACHKCEGTGYLPSLATNRDAGRSLWRTCDSCRGSGETRRL
jgi:DnaJ-class molecular chaperone